MPVTDVDQESVLEAYERKSIRIQPDWGVRLGRRVRLSWYVAS